MPPSYLNQVAATAKLKQIGLRPFQKHADPSHKVGRQCHPNPSRNQLRGIANKLRAHSDPMSLERYIWQRSGTFGKT